LEAEAPAPPTGELELVARRLDEVVRQPHPVRLVVDGHRGAGAEAGLVEVAELEELADRALDGLPAVDLARHRPELAADDVVACAGVAADGDVAEGVDLALLDLEEEVERVARRLRHGLLDVEPEVAAVGVEARDVGVTGGVVEVLLQPRAVVDVARLEAEGRAELGVREHGVPLEGDVADVVTAPLVDLDLDDDAGLGPLADVERVADDAGVVVATVVVEADEALEVLVEGLLVERLAAPEPPPPRLGRVLEPLPEGRVAEGFVPLGRDVDHAEALPPLDVEREGDP